MAVTKMIWIWIWGRNGAWSWYWLDKLLEYNMFNKISADFPQIFISDIFCWTHRISTKPEALSARLDIRSFPPFVNGPLAQLYDKGVPMHLIRASDVPRPIVQALR